MDNWFEWLVVLILVIVLIYYIYRLFNTKFVKGNKSLIGGKGWYFISKKQTPHWIRDKWANSIDWSHGIITGVFDYAKGSHYEYKLVLVDAGHTHDVAVIRRRLKGINKLSNDFWNRLKTYGTKPHWVPRGLVLTTIPVKSDNTQSNLIGEIRRGFPK
jgi:hypothetical protein